MKLLYFYYFIKLCTVHIVTVLIFYVDYFQENFETLYVELIQSIVKSSLQFTVVRVDPSYVTRSEADVNKVGHCVTLGKSREYSKYNHRGF